MKRGTVKSSEWKCPICSKWTVLSQIKRPFASKWTVEDVGGRDESGWFSADKRDEDVNLIKERPFRNTSPLNVTFEPNH